ncbi:UDP-N-acetylmuramoyl-tripeptide--D-alanyl-D-alanine ligase [Sediminispirochaeta bajacaliforniensis]|uniref:UDP-N-acetylmuramoyl-tripeptide--D-alanyl-D- alanine ligase n=1 Tax=Sediminispirochaeta bajacaliforniensis TaxID=148 RepID=UPI00036EA0DE|nr:UDP-N-acetylmuramoyl-tripeptide--D-alanyl-D-alanine ligase [Sediminispirochaeta bajacaliforniensis]
MDKKTEGFSAREAAAVIGAVVFSPSEKKTVTIDGIAIDSRNVKPGNLFVALEGERADGHHYLSEAVRAGAPAVLVDHKKSACVEGGWATFATHSGLVVMAVEDPLVALQRLSRWWIDRFDSLVRIAVTGSSGKTTTKELLGSVLSMKAPTVVNPGNLNSEIGLPLALFGVGPADYFGVFELGINRIGEMELLSSLYHPQHLLITNIGTAHSGPLGGKEGVFREKTKVFAHMQGEGFVFYPEDDDRIDALKNRYPSLTFRPYGPATLTGLETVEDLGTEGWLLRYRGVSIHYPLLGQHNLRNGCGVIALAFELGVSPELIGAALSAAVPVTGRCRLLRGPISVLDDCYNANLDSSERVFEYIASLPWDGRKIIVFGSMKELGPSSLDAHRAAGQAIAASGVDAVFLYGEETSESFREISEQGSMSQILHFSENQFDELSEKLLAFVREGDLVLLKGSRTMGLERLIPLLQHEEKESLHA